MDSCRLNNKHNIHKVPLTYGELNIRSLLDRANTKRPEIITALIARQLNPYKINIFNLSETRLAGEGQISVDGAGYTFFWSLRVADERWEAGVPSYKIKCREKTFSSLQGMNDPLMTFQLPLWGRKYATNFSVYAPARTKPDDIKDKFYENLEE